MNGISSGQQGLPEKKVLQMTVPESPAFALKKRVRMEPRVEEVRAHLVVSNTKLLKSYSFPLSYFTDILTFLQLKVTQPHLFLFR